MNEIEFKAFYGNVEAQEYCTENGIILPCPCCKGKGRVRYTGNNSGVNGWTSNVYYRSRPGFIKCDKCGLQTNKMTKACRALKKWNTRPQIQESVDLEAIKYKRFVSVPKYYIIDDIYYGKIENVDDLVSYISETKEDIMKYFIEAVNDYIEYCEISGKQIVFKR